MDKTEIVDEMGHTFITDQAYMVQADDIDGEVTTASSAENAVNCGFSDDVEQLTAENTDDSNHDGGDKMGLPLREQDRFLPIANVAKIMKRAIPDTGKVYKVIIMSSRGHNIKDFDVRNCRSRRTPGSASRSACPSSSVS